MVSDLFGNEIKPGVLVAIAASSYHTAILRIGKVTKVVEKPHAYHDDRTDVCITVHWAEHELTGFDDKNKEIYQWKLYYKKVGYKDPTNMIVLCSDSVPLEIYDLLKGVKV